MRARPASILLILLALAAPGLGQPNYNPQPRDDEAPAEEPPPAEGVEEEEEPATRELLAEDGTPLPDEEVIPPPLAEDSLLLGDHLHEGATRGDGIWRLESTFAQDDQLLNFHATLTIQSAGLHYWIPQTKGLYLVVMAERLFDGAGIYSYGSSGIGTTLLTSTGMPVVGAPVGNPTDAFGGSTRSPGNRFLLAAPADIEFLPDGQTLIARYTHVIPVGAEFTPGWYRFTAQFGVQLSAKEFSTLAGENPAEIKLNADAASLARFPLTAVKTAMPPRLPVSLFAGVHPGGGALADEYEGRVGLTVRDGFATRTILPPLRPDGGQVQYPLDLALPWLQETDLSAGTFPLTLNPADPRNSARIAIQTPEGTTIDLGAAAITAINAGMLRSSRTNGYFSFSDFGEHTLTVAGQLVDRDGIAYDIGGTWTIYIALPLDLRIATLPGTPGVEETPLFMSARVYPPVPAKIEFNTWVAVHGSEKTRKSVFAGFANSEGEFLPELHDSRRGWYGEGVVVFTNDGEYRIHADARYGAPDGTLYMGQWDSANVVLDNPADGKRDAGALATLGVMGGLGAIGSPSIEGGIDFPFAARDVLFIAPGEHPFAPTLYGRGDTDLVNRRVVPADALVDLNHGARGFEPASQTPTDYPSAVYPDQRDRRGHLYSWSVGPGLPSRLVIRDGRGDLGQSIGGTPVPWKRDSIYTLFGGISVWDAGLEGGAQGSYTGGLVVTDRVNAFSLHSDDANEWMEGADLPFLYQYAVPAGSLIDQFRAISPQCYLYPAREGTLEMTVRAPGGTETYLATAFDERGIAGDLASFAVLELPGVYTVELRAKAGEAAIEPDAYQLYVPNRKSQFTMAIDQPGGTRVDWTSPLTLSGTVAGEGFQQMELFYTLSVDGTALEQGQEAFNAGTFSLDLNLPRVFDLLTGFDGADPHHLADLTLFAVIVNSSGELQTAHKRLTIRQGYLEWVDQGGKKKKRKIFDIF